MLLLLLLPALQEGGALWKAVCGDADSSWHIRSREVMFFVKLASIRLLLPPIHLRGDGRTDNATEPLPFSDSTDSEEDMFSLSFAGLGQSPKKGKKCQINELFFFNLLMHVLHIQYIPS
jgi:hypothetical protein